MDKFSPQSTVDSPWLNSLTKRPDWLKIRLNTNRDFHKLRELNRRLNLNTVCQEAACPNQSNCWSRREVTYLLLGKDCTRLCKFCNINKTKPLSPDSQEPGAIARAVKELGLTYIVLTSVTRDDLPDKGAAHFIETTRLIREKCPGSVIELLIPDFSGREDLLKRVSYSDAGVIGHNIETVESLYPLLRKGSSYKTSLAVLNSLKQYNPNILTKSAILLGLGEESLELINTIGDLKAASVDILYLGQYLSPTKAHWPVKKFYSPEEFKYFKDIALKLGFKTVVSEPLARSSWKARLAHEECLKVKVP